MIAFSKIGEDGRCVVVGVLRSVSRMSILSLAMTAICSLATHFDHFTAGSFVCLCQNAGTLNFVLVLS